MQLHDIPLQPPPLQASTNKQTATTATTSNDHLAQYKLLKGSSNDAITTQQPKIPANNDIRNVDHDNDDSDTEANNLTVAVKSSTTTNRQSDDPTNQDSNLIVSLKLLAIFSTLYFFMWSSGLLSQAFYLASYHQVGHYIRTSGSLKNPLIGLMVGIITTVVFQSSGAVTSVLVNIVGSGVLDVRQSIPIVMGANLGTSVTNTIVALIVYRKKANFEIAMTAGIVHDMYNMMSVVFMLPLELLFHPLEYTSLWLVELFGDTRSEVGELQFLKFLVKPLVDLVIILDQDRLKILDNNTNSVVPNDESLIKRCCNQERSGNQTICHEQCNSLFSRIDLSDNVVCIMLVVIAIVTLITCLVFVVKVTKSLLG